MREILFRGQDAITREWIYGCYVDNRDRGRCPPIIVPKNGNPHIYVFPETVGQFTGITDKNGKHVFEGDILQWVDEDNTCEGTKLIFIVKFDGEYEGFFGEGEFDNIEPWQFRDHEIIGNIHDNTELMTAPKEATDGTKVR